MRILIVIPQQPRETGNRVTAERFFHGLVQFGHKVRLIETESDDPTSIDLAIASFKPDTGLLLHAYRSGRSWLQSSGTQIPFVLMLTGTDLNHDFADKEKRLVMQQVMQQAGAVLTQNQQSFSDLQADSLLAPKLHLLPVAASLGNDKYDLDIRLPERTAKVLLLHPAGIRPVKGNLELLLMCDRLAALNLSFRLLFCGPELDRSYAFDFHLALKERPWASWLSSVPQSSMASLMCQCDVIMNNSISEGLSNALVEALALGKPVLAHKIPANNQLIEQGHNGLLYSNEEEFISQAKKMICDQTLRERLGASKRVSIIPGETEVLNEAIVSFL